LEHEYLTVELRNLKSLMGISINGQDPTCTERPQSALEKCNHDYKTLFNLSSQLCRL